MLICVYTSASVTVSFIIIPWIQNYECRKLILDSASTHLDFAYGQSRWNCCCYKVFCYSSSKYWLKEGHYKPKEGQKDKASKRRTVLPKEGELIPMKYWSMGIN